MSRINSNVQSLIAQRVLGQNNLALNVSLERLSTGLRINRGKDDPAGLIASENLRSEMKSINAAISNSERADQVMNIAEGGLQEVSTLLTELQGLLTASASQAGLGKSEKEANQLQIDSILQTIDRIASATSFQGIKLLNGNFEYTTQSVNAGVDDFRVNGAKFNADSLSVDVVVTQSAQQGSMYLSLGGGTLNLNGAGANQSAFTIEITGTLGSREFQFASSADLSTIADTISNFSDITGVTASASSTGISLTSSGYGSDEFVSVKVINAAGVGTSNSIGVYNFESGDQATVDSSSFFTYDSSTAGNGIRDEGQDIGATINGVAATSNGKTFRINTDSLDVQITLDTDTSQVLGALTAFEITGGGADFQLAANVDIAGKVSVGIGDVATRKLGKNENTDGEFNFLDDLGSGKDLNVVSGDLVMAQKVVAGAIDYISGLRGRLGAFQKNTIGATIRSLSVAVENTTAAESVIRDTDFAAQTAALTRSQILVAASGQVLALANQQPQNALQLLG